MYVYKNYVHIFLFVSALLSDCMNHAMDAGQGVLYLLKTGNLQSRSGLGLTQVSRLIINLLTGRVQQDNGDCHANKHFTFMAVVTLINYINLTHLEQGSEIVYVKQL